MVQRGYGSTTASQQRLQEYIELQEREQEHAAAAHKQQPARKPKKARRHRVAANQRSNQELTALSVEEEPL